MNKQTKYVLMAIGVITLIISLYAYFDTRKEIHLGGSLMGASLIVLSLSKTETKEDKPK